ncbi:MAG: hypothetical protein ACRC62_25115 [Microcoleus sp.]
MAHKILRGGNPDLTLRGNLTANFFPSESLGINLFDTSYRYCYLSFASDRPFVWACGP